MAEIKIDTTDTFQGSALDRIRESGMESGAQVESEVQTQEAPIVNEQAPKAEEANSDSREERAIEEKGEKQKDYSVLKEVFGQDIDDIEKAKEIVRSYQTQSQSSFANDYVKGLNEFMQTGGTKEVYDTIVSVDVQSLDEIGLIKTLQQWQNPELSGEDLELMLKDKYRQLETDSEEDKRIGRVQMIIDAKAAKKELAQVQDQYRRPSSEKDFLAAEQKRLQSWEPKMKDISSSFKGIDFDLGNGQKFTYTDFNEAEKAELKAELEHIIRVSGLDASQADDKAMQSVLRERAIIKKLDKIVGAIYGHAESIVGKASRDRYNNPAPIPKGDDQMPKAAVSAADALFEKQMQRMKGNR